MTRKLKRKGNFKIAYIGNKIDFTYKVKHLGLNQDDLDEKFLTPSEVPSGHTAEHVTKHGLPDEDP